MKKIFLFVAAAAFSVSVHAQTKKNATVAKKPMSTVKKPVASGVLKPVIKNTIDSASYAFGASIGNSLKTTGLTSFNYDVLVSGIKDVLASKTTILTQEQCQVVIEKAISKAGEAKFTANVEAGKTFLTANAKRAGVKTTASGLQYEILTQGPGVKPLATDSVTVHYRGTLLNGKEFDSSYSRNEPTTFPLNQVIKGWTEGVQLMTTGSKYKFYIPYNLAYGERGAGQDIPPYSALIFEIELLKVNGK